jgi:hypothetical protein
MPLQILTDIAKTKAIVRGTLEADKCKSDFLKSSQFSVDTRCYFAGAYRIEPPAERRFRDASHSTEIRTIAKVISSLPTAAARSAYQEVFEYALDVPFCVS